MCYAPNKRCGVGVYETVQNRLHGSGLAQYGIFGLEPARRVTKKQNYIYAIICIYNNFKSDVLCASSSQFVWIKCLVHWKELLMHTHLKYHKDHRAVQLACPRNWILFLWCLCCVCLKQIELQKIIIWNEKFDVKPKIKHFIFGTRTHSILQLVEIKLSISWPRIPLRMFRCHFASNFSLCNIVLWLFNVHYLQRKCSLFTQQLNRYDWMIFSSNVCIIYKYKKET